ncbi:MAG: hypothetical protein ACYTGB_18210 [Planctomycetota bacterium]|jgi:tetratricopeptide (TPR) repeat protein
MSRALNLGLAGLLLFAAATGGCKPSPDASKCERIRNLLISEDQDDRAAGAELAPTVTERRYQAKLIPLLIDRLDPKKEVNPWASIFAAGALETMTGQDFGSERRSYDRWRKWWFDEASEKLPRRRKNTKSFLERARAERKNEEGEFQLAGGNPVVALNLFREAVALDGSRPVHHSNLGLALLRVGQHEQAEARFEDAIAVDKNYIPAYLNKGTVYADLADKIRAAALRVEAALASHQAAGDEQAAARLKTDLDRALARIRELDDKAIDTFQHAVAVNSGGDLWAAHYLMGRVYKRRGDFEKAVKPLEKALELSVATTSLQRMEVLGHALSQIGIRSDLALTYYALDQYYSAWTQIKTIERLGGKMPEGFTKKVELKVKEMAEELKKKR